MKAAGLLLRRRIPYSLVSFAEPVLRRLPTALAGSAHPSQYRLAYMVNGLRVLRYDNGSGKGDHRHFRGKESRCDFEPVDKLLTSIQRDIQRINREDCDA